MDYNMTTKLPQQQHSPWHSPVPYLFGGLAAMLGLIVFALLILACSYWKLSGYLEGRNVEEGNTGDIESGDQKQPGDAMGKVTLVYEEKIVVIMAGDQKPSFLATPMSSRASSFGDKEKNKVVDDESDWGRKQMEDGDCDDDSMVRVVDHDERTQENKETQSHQRS